MYAWFLALTTEHYTLNIQNISSRKPHSAEWTPWSAILILQQSMMVYAVGFGFGFFGFRFQLL